MSSNRWRSLRRAAGLLSGAVLAAACSTPIARAHLTDTGRIPLTSASRCPTTHLSAHGGRQGGGFVGEAEGTVVITNVGPGSCVLSGIPSVTLLRSDGTPLAVEPTRATNREWRPALLQTGHSATLIVYWANWCGDDPGPLQIRVDLATELGVVTGAFNGPPNYNFVPSCRDSTQASTLTVVDAYIPG